MAKKPNGKQYNKIGRDILFIERNLDFLKPGGRMAIVLPQGRFNNSSDKNIREFIAERCRILAVVGLHGNTFKPHTGTKTSVLLVQKWNDDPKVGALCPRQDDYNIFFATMRKSGKDNSGEKIYVKKGDDSPELLLDNHKHWIVDHDLYNHEGFTEDGIAEAFIEFAKKENLSFFEIPPANATPLFKGGRGGSFDALKYQGLMDRLEAAEVCFSQLERTTRIDSEFFKKYHIKLSKLLNDKETEPITKFVHVSDGNHLKISDSFSDEGIPYYRGQDVHTFFIERANPIFINKEAYNQSFMIRSHLHIGDILLSIIGTIGAVSLVSTNQPATCNCKLAILRPKKQKSEFLAVFLHSKFGQSQIDRFTRGAIQMGLLLEDMDQIMVPILNQNFQQLVINIVNNSKLFLNQADLTYKQAEELLLSELGLKDWQPPEETITVKYFSDSFLSSGRFDAEYYQPKYDELENLIKSYIGGWANIRDVLIQDIKNGTTPKKVIREFIPNKAKFVRAEAFNQSLEINRESLYSIEEETFKKYKSIAAHKDDVLVSMTGTIGNVAVYSTDEPAIINQNIVKLTCDKSFINPYILALYIKFVGQSLLVRQQTGNVQPYVNIPNFKNLIVPLFCKESQDKIWDCLKKASNQRAKSKQLLEIAKIGVEKAI